MASSNKKIKYTYDVVDLIELVEQRPCLWDKAAVDYKNRLLKEKSWKEICQFLINDYDNLEDNEKLTQEKLVSEKWRHIRDAFGLSLRKKCGDKRSKQYIYHDQLKFLTKNGAKNHADSSTIADDEESRECKDAITEERDSQERDQCFKPTSFRSRKRSHASTMNATDMAIFKVLESATQPRPQLVIDEDAGFFASITPSIKKFNEDQKLLFRMKVLGLIREIKSQHSSISSVTASSHCIKPIKDQEYFSK